LLVCTCHQLHYVIKFDAQYPTARSGIGENQEQPSFFRIPGHLSVSNPHSRRHGISGNLAELNALLFVAHLSSRPAAQRWLRGRSEAHPIDNDNDAADEKRNCFGICGSSKPKSHIKPKHRENEARPKQTMIAQNKSRAAMFAC
jgi:hypothetical protein